MDGGACQHPAADSRHLQGRCPSRELAGWVIVGAVALAAGGSAARLGDRPPGRGRIRTAERMSSPVRLCHVEPPALWQKRLSRRAAQVGAFGKEKPPRWSWKSWPRSAQSDPAFHTGRGEPVPTAVGGALPGAGHAVRPTPILDGRLHLLRSAARAEGGASAIPGPEPGPRRRADERPWPPWRRRGPAGKAAEGITHGPIAAAPAADPTCTVCAPWWFRLDIRRRAHIAAMTAVAPAFVCGGSSPPSADACTTAWDTRRRGCTPCCAAATGMATTPPSSRT